MMNRLVAVVCVALIAAGCAKKQAVKPAEPAAELSTIRFDYDRAG